MKTRIDKATYQRLIAEKDFRLATQKMKIADAITLLPNKSFEPSVTKGRYLYENDEEKGILKRTIVANTYNWLDSHGDVHLNGIFAKSIQERGTRIPHLHDHKFQLAAKVGRPLSFAEVDMKWRALGHPKNGDTVVLLMESQIEARLNKKVYEEYKDDAVDQHSVGMIYTKIELAANDDNYKSEYETWEEVFPLLGNKEEAEEAGFFFAVREAKLIEVSAVLLGSNVLTPTLNNKIQPGKPTEKTEPVKTTLNVNDLVDVYRKSIIN